MKMSMRGRKKKTAPAGAVAEAPSARLLRGPGDEVLVLDGLAALDDRNRRERAGFHGEDRYLGVAAVALGVEDDLAGGSGELDLAQLRKILRRVGGVRLLHRGDKQVRRVVSE